MRWEHWVHTVPLRLRSVFRRQQVEQELDDEIRFHFERQIAEDIAKGSTPEQACEAAHRSLRGIERLKEECRDARRVSAVDELRRNVRFALRRIRRTPGLSSAAILTLALGIGATTTVFTALNTLVLRPLPVEAGDRLVSLNHGDAVSFSYPDYSRSTTNVGMLGRLKSGVSRMQAEASLNLDSGSLRNTTPAR